MYRVIVSWCLPELSQNPVVYQPKADKSSSSCCVWDLSLGVWFDKQVLMTLRLELSQDTNPYGVRPCGNLFMAPRVQEEEDEDGAHISKKRTYTSEEMRTHGLGPFLRRLEDETLVMEVLGALDGQDLARLSRCSRGLHVLCHHQELWKALLVNALLGGEGGGRLVFRHSWKDSYITHHLAQRAAKSTPIRHVPLRFSPGLASDFLYQPLLAAGVRVFPKAWLIRDNVPRLHQPSLEEFRSKAEVPNAPVVLSGVMEEWGAFRDLQGGKAWDALAHLAHAQGGGIELHGGGLTWGVEDYVWYAKQQRDDLPLIIFDKAFDRAWPQLAQGYEKQLPPYFSHEDLFAALGSQRPDWRWLILGPRRSGSTFHKDPNSTSAWNAVLRGAKKWVLFPPHVTPPGVHPSEDGLDLATPVTLLEWFTGFYAQACREHRGVMKECVVREGEVMFVPRGWWHLVLNVEDSLAITQNYVSSVNLPHVLTLLDEHRHLVSGVPDADRPLLYDRFVASLKQHHPHLLTQAQQQRQDTRQHALTLLKAKAADDGPAHACAQVFAERDATDQGQGGKGKEAQEGGWSFNFQLA